MPSSALVFTDLDGSLLDHDDYSYVAAKPALARLRERGIPLVLCTSKTVAEIHEMRENPDFSDCAAIVENGAAVLEAGALEARPAPTHAQLMKVLEGLPKALRSGFSGFSSWSIATLSEYTGLDRASAARAAARDYSEPGLWLGTEQARQDFVDELSGLGISAQQGGRFLTLGFGANKADRMREMIAAYRVRKGEVIAIALGDAPNDFAMLQDADIGILLPNPAQAADSPALDESCSHIIRASAPGPVGWNTSLLSLLDGPLLQTQGR